MRAKSQHLTERETDDLLQIKEQQAHCSPVFLPLFSHPIYPPLRIIDAIHAPEMLRRCDFLLLLPPLFLRSLFFPQPQAFPGHWRLSSQDFLSAQIKCDRLAKGAHDRSSDGRQE